MSQLPYRSAIKALLLVALFWAAGASWAAQVAGTIVHLNGPLMAKKADGAVRILSVRSEVESGDTLLTEKNTYAMVKFIDNSEITLKPSTTFKVDNFSYDAAKPEGDNASFSLVKGGLRSVTGLLGKRNKEKFAMKTPTATIGIRGTTFTLDWFQPTPEQLANGQKPHLRFSVTEGKIGVENKGGITDVDQGQFGMVPDTDMKAIVLPKDPGLNYNPPPNFKETPPAPGPGASIPPKSNNTDCIAR